MNKFEIDSECSNQNIAFHHIFQDYPELHTHDYWEFFVVLDGSYKHKINGNNVIMSKNHGYLIRPNDCHALYNNEEICSHLNILIREDYIKHIINSFSPYLLDGLLAKDELPVFLNDAQTERIVSYVSLLKEDVSSGVDIQLVSNLLTGRLLELVINQGDILKSGKPAWLTNVLIQINSPKNINWSVNDVLSKSNYSHTHFARLFKEYMGCTLIQYFTKVKMSNAQDFLLHSNMSVLDISEALGYSSLSHFIHVFKKYYGTSPIQYKKANKVM